MKKQNHVNNLDEAMKWLNAYDYRVWDGISKRTERTAYRHDVNHFVNEMIDCFNEMK